MLDRIQPETFDEKLKLRKSRVRVAITYWAAIFLFAVPIVMIITFFKLCKYDEALTLFNSILPVAAGIISYWFATRSKEAPSDDKDDKDGNKQPKAGD